MLKALVLTIIGFVLFVGCGLILQSHLLMDEIPFVILYASTTYPIVSIWVGLILAINSTGDDD